MVVAALRPADEFLAPLGDPFDRPPEPPRRPQNQHPFGIEKVLHPEPAADIGRGQLDALGRQPEHRLGELVADAVDALSGQQQVESAGARVIIADRRPRLDRRRHEAVVDELDLDDLGRGGERRCDGGPVSPLKPEAEVSRRLVPDRRRPGQQRRRSIDHRVERPVFDRDPLGGVARQLAGFRDNQRHRIADMAYPPARQRKTRRHDHRIDRADLRDAGEGTDTVGAQIAFGKHPEHPTAVPRRRSVDPLDRGMRMRRPQHMSIDLPRQ